MIPRMIVKLRKIWHSDRDRGRAEGCQVSRYTQYWGEHMKDQVDTWGGDECWIGSGRLQSCSRSRCLLQNTFSNRGSGRLATQIFIDGSVPISSINLMTVAGPSSSIISSKPSTKMQRGRGLEAKYRRDSTISSDSDQSVSVSFDDKEGMLNNSAFKEFWSADRAW